MQTTRRIWITPAARSTRNARSPRMPRCARRGARQSALGERQSLASTAIINEAKARLLRRFSTRPTDYVVCFTANTSRRRSGSSPRASSSRADATAGSDGRQSQLGERNPRVSLVTRARPFTISPLDEQLRLRGARRHCVVSLASVQACSHFQRSRTSPGSSIHSDLVDAAQRAATRCCSTRPRSCRRTG